MQRYVLRRLLITIPTLLGITIVSFVTISLAPGDAVAAMVMSNPEGRPIGAQEIQALRARYGLDKPLPVRYLVWLRSVAQGNLGIRISDNRPVSDVIRERIGPTVELMGLSMLVACLIGIPLGVVSALKHHSRLDYTLTVAAFVGISLPEFFAAIGLIYLLAVRLDWLPVSGRLTRGADFSLVDHLLHLVLPVTVLALFRVAGLVRYVRSSMLETLYQDYVTTARAKGLATSAVVFVHAFRNALLPVITVLALMLPAMVGGAVIIETIFQWPGIGLLYIDSVNSRDYSTLMSLVLLTGLAVALSNLLADLLYAVADPRIRYT
jgi:peptide/nickel transport system permease protein